MAHYVLDDSKCLEEGLTKKEIESTCKTKGEFLTVTGSINIEVVNAITETGIVFLPDDWNTNVTRVLTCELRKGVSPARWFTGWTEISSGGGIAIIGTELIWSDNDQKFAVVVFIRSISNIYLPRINYPFRVTLMKG